MNTLKKTLIFYLIFNLDVSINDKITLFSQSILETGNFHNTNYNNIFGIMKNNKKVRYKSYDECISHRLKIYIKNNNSIQSNYAEDMNYKDKLNKIKSKVRTSFYQNRCFLLKLVNEIDKDNLEYISYSDNRFSNYSINSFNQLLYNLEIPFFKDEITKRRIYVLDSEHIERLKIIYSLKNSP